MCIFRFYFQGSSGFFCSVNITYKPLQNRERPVPQIWPCTGCKLGVKERQKAWLLHLPCTAPVLAALVTQSGLCSYMVSKSLENYLPQALIYITGRCVGLWNCLWKGFWKSKYSLSHSVTIKAGITVTFSIGSFHLLHRLHEKCIVGIVRCGSAPWSAEQWAYQTENKDGHSLPVFDKYPSQTSTYRAVPQILGLAYMFAFMQEKLRPQQLRKWM